MRIGIEAQRLYRPHKHGMDRVALELIRNLQVIDTENEYFIFVKPDEDCDGIPQAKNFNVVEIPGGPYPVWEQLKLPKIAESYNIDILHCTSNTAPVNTKIPLITTLHDVIFKEMSLVALLTNGASWYQKIGNLYRRCILDKVVSKSKKLITVSNFEKGNILNAFKLNSSNLEAVHNGVNESYAQRSDEETKQSVKVKYNLPNRYLLHLGNTDPRKNTKRVLEAFHHYLKDYDGDCKLVIVGINETVLNAELNALGLFEALKDKVILTGYVADEDLPVVFHMSQLFLFPSLREGFGIPVIEAMASGVPVITSNTSSMPEVAGDAALIVDPNRTEEITNGIVKILSDDSYKTTLIEKGLTRYKQFSWKNAAKRVLELYNQLYIEQKNQNHD